MYKFNSLKAAASFSLRAKVAFVFNGPNGGYVVAIGKEARKLEASGLEALTACEVSAAVK